MTTRSIPADAAAARLPRSGSSRSFWLKHLHQWHWVSAALCLVGMMLFAVTGFTLNHAADIVATPRTVSRTATLPAALVAALPQAEPGEKHPLPPMVRDWLARELAVSAGDRPAEWSADEIYLALPRPGGDAWLRIDRATGEITHEVTSRGWISYLDDLHKGRHAGLAWSWFLDLFALACLVFCSTGLLLLHFHAGARPATWPVVGLGLVVPLILAILFIH